MSGEYIVSACWVIMDYPGRRLSGPAAVKGETVMGAEHGNLRPHYG